VGVDIDAEHMVCDLVPWERMVQRLGRVNRLGQFEERSHVDVFPAVSDKDKDAETSADAERIKRWRAPFDSPLWQADKDERRDASPGQLRRLREIKEFQELAKKATTPDPLRPALTRALVEDWSMTSLDDHSGRPDVAPWLRGWDKNEQPQTQILWRRHLPIRRDDNRVTATRAFTEFLEEAPPHLSEVLETYTHTVVDLMRSRAKALLKGRRGDAVQEPENIEGDQAKPTSDTVVAVVLAPSRKVERLFSLNEIDKSDPKRIHAAIVGRTVILDARLGGLDQTGLLNPRQDKEPATLDGDLASSIADESEDRRWSEKRLRTIGFRVRREMHKAGAHGDWKVVHQRFVKSLDEEADNPDAVEWRVENWVGDGAARADPALARKEQGLREHCDDVVNTISKIANALQLPEPHKRMLVLAARGHDFGKARTNWQAYAGNPGFRRDPMKPLAKFAGRANPALLKIGDETYRHEFGSLRDVSMAGTLNEIADDDLHELALHLIAAHHGNARPVIAPVDPDDEPSASIELARQVALRFAAMQKKRGPWGLAWWETLLRAADIAASRDHDRRGEND
jgi:CRISPR-associated endonuclease/helicase Cas3